VHCLLICVPFAPHPGIAKKSHSKLFAGKSGTLSAFFHYFRFCRPKASLFVSAISRLKQHQPIVPAKIPGHQHAHGNRVSRSDKRPLNQVFLSAPPDSDSVMEPPQPDQVIAKKNPSQPLGAAPDF
jgi:hypothetical protein